MQDLGETTNSLVYSSEKIPYKMEDYLLQNFDIVEINIKTTSPELNTLFNVIVGENANNGMMMGQNGGDVFFMNGYTIDEFGMVELPLVGELELRGLSVNQAKLLIASRVSKFVNEDEYFVRVRLGGIRFSALGEFNMPGKQTVLQNRVSIFEAIAVAGDLNIFAKRNELVLVRQYPDGSQIHKINLNDRSLLGSDFYFIRPNDILYAEPLKVREVGSGGNFIQSLTLVTSTITTIALVLTLINN
ncbi:polysaccharide biosynthesis/export family protein [Rhodonellum sp.]|uniref:polysaccharide biosynthesis/export family protein n=1 Tax=Rhodonellum sp. TaxID=2231180 RepID=UPI002721F01C|nr:polysaccharide biosynthesis/export family protein [Rhodonellum sp.]MDO9551446.1 polysaccharide biosynthesis/export family protein [Rhodonellum sp.]